MNKRGFGVDVIFDIDEKILSHRPSCPHGPMLMFERYTKNGKNNGRRFFACSASRSRKFCKSFFWADEITKQSTAFSAVSDDLYNCNKSREVFLNSSTNTSRNFCQTCSVLFMSEESQVHKAHSIQKVSNEQMLRPSKLLTPQEDSRQYAQYFFSEHTVTFLVETLRNLHIKNVLCIGTPRVHEELTISGFSSLLLDIDERYAQFYDCKSYLKYNMFNNYFFELKTAAYRELLSGDDVCVLLDPPFGGLVDALAHTVKQIIADCKKCKSRTSDLQPLVLWFFPYFNERRIVQAFPAMKMLDFNIDYENHTSFKESFGKKDHGSPIRIFTNYEPKLFKPLVPDKYRFCEICQKFVASHNLHCWKCQACTSKDGRPYKHCDVCELCVKASWHHCTKCKKCVTQDHQCDLVPVAGLCHLCHGEGHKRKQCPTRCAKKRKKIRTK